MPADIPATTLAATFHPLAEVFPLVEGDEFQRLVTDIKVNGLRQPIVQLDGMILDGRNRYRACLAAGRPPRYANMPRGTDPLAYVMSANLHRRHLNESQRAMVAARLANMPFGGNQHIVETDTGSAPLPTLIVTQSEAATMLDVSSRSLRSAKVVQDKGVASLVGQVERGTVAVAIAEKIARLPVERQEEISALAPDRMVHEIKRTRRETREVELSDKTRAAAESLGIVLANVIYADPPWRFEVRSDVTGMDRSADNHYPTMTFEDICKIVPPAAEDCVLFLWSTAPMQPEALALLDAWGFEYKTQWIWHKERAGTGYWNRNKHEVLILATRGNVPAPAPGDQFPSVIEAMPGRHSAKPTAFVEMIEAMFPNCVRLEMFARGSREGWITWGNEAVDAAVTAGAAA